MWQKNIVYKNVKWERTRQRKQRENRLRRWHSECIHRFVAFRTSCVTSSRETHSLWTPIYMVHTYISIHIELYGYVSLAPSLSAFESCACVDSDAFLLHLGPIVFLSHELSSKLTIAWSINPSMAMGRMVQPSNDSDRQSHSRGEMFPLSSGKRVSIHFI